MLFRVIIRARNAERLIGKTLRSLAAQTCDKWVAHVALDAPKDRTMTAVDNFRANARLPVGKVSISVSDKNLGVAAQIHRAPWLFKQHCDTSPYTNLARLSRWGECEKTPVACVPPQNHEVETVSPDYRGLFQAQGGVVASVLRLGADDSGHRDCGA